MGIFERFVGSMEYSWSFLLFILIIGFYYYYFHIVPRLKEGDRAKLIIEQIFPKLAEDFEKLEKYYENIDKKLDERLKTITDILMVIRNYMKKSSSASSRDRISIEDLKKIFDPTDTIQMTEDEISSSGEINRLREILKSLEKERWR